MPPEVLVSALAGSFDPALPIFVLIDPMLGEPIPVAAPAGDDAVSLNAARSQGWGRDTQVIALAPGIDLPTQQHPYLVALRSPRDPWIAETVRLALDEQQASRADGVSGSGIAPHRIGGWLQSSLDAPALAELLATLMRVDTRATTTARYQRLADRRVIAWMRHVVGDERVAATMGRLHTWRYLDAVGHLSTLTSAGEGPSSSSICLSRTEWADFMRGELVHPTLARWLGEAGLDLPSSIELPRASAPDLARSAFTRSSAALTQAQLAAKRWPERFIRQADHVAWAALTLLDENIASRDGIVALLEVPREAGEPVESIDTMSARLHAICRKSTP